MPHRLLSEIVAGQHLITVSPEDSVFDAVCKMSEHQCGIVLVLDPEGQLEGVFTERDLMRRVVSQEKEPKATRVEDVMTRNIASVPAGRKGIEAVRRMVEHNIHHVVVTGMPDGGYGVVSVSDFIGDEIDVDGHELQMQRKVWETV